ncbi:glycosyltransferase family 4 protein [Desulfoplanes formicivorans]|uniref:Glycosyl transferase n=1 Tax=Desulfoplanes formicivorans TaxID=1592317 RepID=A0A194AL70_9BACT|nr:glycosyltransferase family 4 protein [Desulfoplanes formicivorans]GAU09786.1 glycosyl transferase [Desulfoplanes formicivorans]
MTAKRIWGTLDPFVEGGAYMGRKVANAGFLQTLIGSGTFDEYHFFLADGATISNTKKNFQQMALPSRAVIRFLGRRQLPGQLATTPYHCFHLSDCINWPASLAALRNRYARQLFPITSLTHSLSPTRYVREMLPQIWQGTTSRDCIVSSSTAGRRVVENIFAQARAYLGRSWEDAQEPVCRVIPLGIDLDGFSPPTPEERMLARQERAVGDKEVVLLVFGRISPHSKMDLLPLLRALQRLFWRGISRPSLCLWVAGWVDAGDEFPATLKTLARNMGLRMELIPSPDERVKRRLFAGADIFVSLADNPQETFGLSLLEAGGMGLPVVASDFDGYRDIVVHGQTGFLVPTMGNPQTSMIDEMAPLVSDYHYHLWLSQGTVVAVPPLADRLYQLIQDVTLRQRMGLAGHERVAARFSWERVVAQYVELWNDLWSVPVDPPRPLQTHPLNMAYGKVFERYCSTTLSPSTRLVWTRCGQATYRQQDFLLIYAGLEDWITPELVRQLLFFCRKPITAERLIKKMQEWFPGMGEDRLYLVVLWACKQDLITMVDAWEQND